MISSKNFGEFICYEKDTSSMFLPNTVVFSFSQGTDNQAAVPKYHYSKTMATCSDCPKSKYHLTSLLFLLLFCPHLSPTGRERDCLVLLGQNQETRNLMACCSAPNCLQLRQEGNAATFFATFHCNIKHRWAMLIRLFVIGIAVILLYW